MGRFLLFFFLFPQSILAQNEDVSIPFIIVNNRLILKYEFNHSVLNLLLDTGSTNILDSVQAIKIGLKVSKEVNLIPSPGGLIRAYFLNSGFVLGNLGSVNWITNFGSWKTDYSCRIDGMIGYDLLKKFKVELDFQGGFMHLFRSNVTLSSKYHELTLVSSDFGAETAKYNSMFKLPALQGNITFDRKQSYTSNFIIDTGSKYEISFLVSDSNMLKKISKGKTKYINFSGTSMLVDYCKPQLTICKLQRKISGKVVIFYIPRRYPDYSDFGERELGGMLGLPFLLRYKNVIIDLPNKKLYLKN